MTTAGPPAQASSASAAPGRTTLLAERHTRAIDCRIAAGPADRRQHFLIRQAVFVQEQAVFLDTDRDPRDEAHSTIHAIGLVDEVAVGAVRLYPLDDSGLRWQGDRLAVLSDYRAAGVGGPLVKFAVATANRFGGQEMHAHIQPSNVRFFEYLGWVKAGAEEIYVGLPHQPMHIRW